MKKNVLVLIPMEDRHVDMLKNAAPEYDFRFVNGGEETQEDADWANISLGNINAKYLHGNANLKWVQTSSAGVEPYIEKGVLAEGTKLTNATGAYGLAISEHMLGMLLEIQKKLSLYRDQQKEHKWGSLGKVTSVYGSTVLVLGLGDIGGEFAKRCKALGAYVIGMRRKDTSKPEYADEICLTEDLDKVLPRADVVAITLPGTKETANMIDKKRIESMKDEAIILNVGRGSIIDTEAMCDALISGKLMGAGLDVTMPEPLPEGHRLWDIPTAVITPHISGFYHLKETHERIVRIFAENLKHFYNGENLKNPVDFAAGYANGEKPV